jgi:tetratricopeptide (TPR) repeat protein
VKRQVRVPESGAEAPAERGDRVARSGNRVRITAQLIDGASDEHIWGRSYEDQVEDVLALQSRIATAIAAEVRGAVSSSAGPGTRRAVDPAVYHLYLRGRNAWNTRTPERFDRARSYFQQAIDKDPSFALAHVGLADTYQVAGLLTGTADGPAQARAAAERAVVLDPLAGVMRQTLALVNYFGRRYDRAIADGRRALELAPHLTLARQIVARSLVERGRAAEAVRMLSEQPQTSPEELAVLAIACNRSGDDGRAAAIVKDLTSRDPQPLAALGRWYAATGDATRALAAFEQMVARRPGALQAFKNDPAFERLKTSPRFRQLVAAAGV